MGSHGLFGDENYVDLKKVTAELQGCEKKQGIHWLLKPLETETSSPPTG